MPKGIYKHKPQQGFQSGDKNPSHSNPSHKGIKHSQKTKNKLRDIHKGKHYSISTEFKKGRKNSEETKQKMKGRVPWNKGKTKPNKRPRHDGFEYIGWRKSVFERDGYKCQICENVGGKLQAHHINGWSKFPELRYELSNGITLCDKCHKLTPNYGNKK